MNFVLLYCLYILESYFNKWIYVKATEQILFVLVESDINLSDLAFIFSQIQSRYTLVYQNILTIKT